MSASLWMRRVTLAFLAASCAAHAQQSPGNPPDPSAAERAYEERIQALEKRLAELESAAKTQHEQDELDALLKQAEAAGPPPVARPSTQQSVLNPKISVIPDFTGFYHKVTGDNEVADAFPGLFEEDNPFDLRSVDVEFRAPVSPGADAVAILGVGEEEAAFEEAYVVLHDLPWDLKAKVGRFKLGFGRMNVIHNHDLPQTDRPLVHRLVFGDEGTSGDGVSLSRPLYSNDPGSWLPTWSDITVEVVNAANEESPLFGTEAHQEVAAVARWKNFWQIDDHQDLESGISTMQIGDSPESTHGQVGAYGLDLTWRYKDPVPGSFRDWLVQAEVIRTSVENGHPSVKNPEPSEDVDALGEYLTVQRRLDEQHYLGVRLDHAESPQIEDADVYGITPYLTWYMNEFLRLRLQYQYLNGSVDHAESHSHALGFQLTWVFGAHPPEPYWVNK